MSEETKTRRSLIGEHSPNVMLISCDCTCSCTDAIRTPYPTLMIGGAIVCHDCYCGQHRALPQRALKSAEQENR